MTKLNEAEFRLITMCFGATLEEVDAECRKRCASLGQPCWADRAPVVNVEVRDGA
jgi:hypothetical protein